MVRYRGKHKSVVYEISKPVKCGFRPFILRDPDNDYTYCFKLLEDLKSDECGKIHKLVKDFMHIVLANKTLNYEYILSTDGIYISEDFLGENDFYFIGSISKNNI